MTYAVIRVRGTVNVRGDIKETLRLMRLNKVNHCVIIPNTPHYNGMIQKVKDYVTWGEIAPETLAKTLILHGELKGSQPIDDKYIKANTKYSSVMAFSKAVVDSEIKYSDLKNVKPVVRLHPPLKGWGGIKRHYSIGGALGYRGKEINPLLERMLTSKRLPTQKEGKEAAPMKAGARKEPKKEPKAAKKKTAKGGR